MHSVCTHSRGMNSYTHSGIMHIRRHKSSAVQSHSSTHSGMQPQERSAAVHTHRGTMHIGMHTHTVPCTAAGAHMAVRTVTAAQHTSAGASTVTGLYV